MEEIQCYHCGHFVPKSLRHKEQYYCGKPECQKARKGAWKRKKMRDDPEYRLNHQAVRDMGLSQPRRVLGNVNFNPPRSHSLRHSFAVNTLINIKQRGESAQYALPILAVYMGHSDYKHTAVYLKVVDAKSRKNLVDFTLWQKRKR